MPIWKNVMKLYQNKSNALSQMTISRQGIFCNVRFVIVSPEMKCPVVKAGLAVGLITLFRKVQRRSCWTEIVVHFPAVTSTA